jgi:SAM-dependent methyltransferase
MEKHKLETKQFWKEEIKKHVMLYPDERVVEFIANNYKEKDNSNKNALDLGFGSGRNLIPLLDYGFNAYGIDYNEECCKVAKKLLINRSNLKELYNDDVKNIDFPEEFFDVVINYGVAFYNVYSDIIENLKNIHRIMKKGGKMIINFRTKDDFLYGKGEKIDKYSYILDERAKEYMKLTYTFFDYEEAKELLEKTGFAIKDCEKIELWKHELKDKNKWWIFSVECI